MTSRNGDFSHIPLVDFSQWRGGDGDTRARLVEEVREICHHVGFMVLTGHGIDQSLIDGVFNYAARFFALPEAQKALIDKRQSRHFRGWEGVGAELTNGRPDMREQIDLWSEHRPRPKDVQPPYLRLLGPNQWLPEDVLPGFHATMDRWFAELGKLADSLMQVLAVGLGLEPDHFDRHFGAERMSLTKIIHYPPTPEGHFGVNAHKDAGFLTILAPGRTPGLEVQNSQDEWVPVAAPPDAFVINIGEMLQAMSAHYFIATPHRVVTRAERLSVGYFHGPSLETTLEPVPLAPELAAAVAASPRHQGAGYMARREETQAGVGDMASHHKPAVYGEQVWNYLGRSYPGSMAAHYPEGSDVVTMGNPPATV